MPASATAQLQETLARVSVTAVMVVGTRGTASVVQMAATRVTPEPWGMLEAAMEVVAVVEVVVETVEAEEMEVAAMAEAETVEVVVETEAGQEVEQVVVLEVEAPGVAALAAGLVAALAAALVVLL